VPTGSKPLVILFGSVVATTVLAALIAVATLWLGDRAQSDDDWVRHTLLVRNQTVRANALIRRAESSQRGYLITGSEDYLKPFGASVADFGPALDGLAKLTADNPKELASIARLRKLGAEKIAEMRATIDKQKAGQTAAAFAVVNTNVGMKLMDDIRSTALGMLAEEERLLKERQASADRFGHLLQIGSAAGVIAIFAVGLLVLLMIRRSFRVLGRAHDQLVATNHELVEQIHQREEAESRLRQVQKMEAIGQLTGGIAHDFNNMLGVISASLQLMQRRIERKEYTIDRFMDAATKAVERAAALTHRLLAFARQQPLSPQPLDANRMIANMSDLLRSTLGEQVRIEAVSAAGLWSTKVDSHQLENAILNVAINGRDAMKEGGKLTVETANAYLDESYARQHTEVAAGQHVMIAVTDTGTGMPPDVIARAFDPFFTTKPTGAGTGLGLSQVFGFVKQSKGHIKIYSEIGSGTAVKIYLPRFQGESEETTETETARVRSGSFTEVILVVEDEPLMRRLAVDALRELGYTVCEAESAANALKIVDERSDIVLLFTDVVMPDMNGKKLADEALRRRPGLKVLFTTGYTPNAVVHGGVLDAGAQFITKPFTVEQLGDKVRGVLEN